MGELNFSKNSLRLPLELVSSTSSEVSSDFLSTDIVTKDLEAVKPEISSEESKMLHADDDESEKLMNESILPTPLSGSMDSLSSSSHSASSNTSSSPSFTTFGKDKIIIKDTDSIGKTSIIFIEDNIQVDSNGRVKNIVEQIENGKIVVGSSDDDSGFENVQIKCEAK